MLWTTLGFLLLAAALVAWQMRQRGGAADAGEGDAAATPCPRCGAAFATAAAACPSCGAPRGAYALVTAKRAAPAAAPGATAAAAAPHALVRKDVCVGCGTCVAACPEPGAIRLVDHVATVSLDACVGHGQCAAACPVGAIVLSSGEAVQAVEVPDLSVHFETTVPGLYIVGELGGRGLIKNAINEGRLAVDHVAARGVLGTRAGVEGWHDVVIVGSGPAGLSAALSAHRAGLKAVVLEQGSLADTIHKYPRAKLLLEEPARTPLYGELWVADASKETLLTIWQNLIAQTPLDVRTQRRVEAIERNALGFVVVAGEERYPTRSVILAMGRRGTPRRLGVPGEELDHVYYDIVEMEEFAGKSVLVVGGGDSAIESAVGLANQPGTRVTLSYRGETFARVKPRNVEKLDALVARGRITLRLASEVVRIAPGEAVLAHAGEERAVPADSVVVRIGGEPPRAFLERLGVRIVRKELAIAALVAAFAAAALAPATVAWAQVSPGPLARAHAKLDGATQCFQCHPGPGAPKAAMDQRCLACHGEIRALKAAGRGYHARVTGACASCHPDHGGRDFQMIAWPNGAPDKFDHATTGTPLEGAHARVPCRDCHKPANQRPPIAPLLRVGDHARSWLGLATACASCHADPHQGSLGNGCLSCHDLAHWKPAPRFDHARARFALEGAHATTPCLSCHKPGPAAGDAPPVPVFKPVAHAACTDCHADPHGGRMGKDCTRCHGTASFHALKAGGFDHGKTRFPLVGAHAGVSCAGCHDPKKAWGEHPRFDTCNACHADPHAGKATLAGKPATCDACHDQRAFRPAAFTVARHAASAFPLLGMHAKVECQACHTRHAAGDPGAAGLGEARVLLRPGHTACADCHADVHGGQLAARPDQGRCEACHGVEGFKPSRIAVKDHAAFRFALTGRHAATACAACHGARRRDLPAPEHAESAGKAGFVFALGEAKCVSCHADPHGGQFATRKDAGACSACHGTAAFVPVTGFDHARQTGFALQGAHAKVACADCHHPPKGAPRGAIVIYHGTPTACVACHASGAKGEGDGSAHS